MKTIEDLLGSKEIMPEVYHLDSSVMNQLSKYKLPSHNGIYDIYNENKFVKISSKTHKGQVKIPLRDYPNFDTALYDAQLCAKVYERFIDENIFNPMMNVFVAKDNSENLTVVGVMPKMEVRDNDPDVSSLSDNICEMVEAFDLWDVKDCFFDMFHPFNWGWDGQEFYYHDMDIVPGYGGMLKIADKLGIE